MLDIPLLRGGSDVAAARYEIVVRGRLGSAFVGWFDDLEVRSSGSDETYLCGWFADQPALQGVLAELGELGVELTSVLRLPDPAD
jgi:hypothetical protein